MLSTKYQSHQALCTYSFNKASDFPPELDSSDSSVASEYVVGSCMFVSAGFANTGSVCMNMVEVTCDVVLDQNERSIFYIRLTSPSVERLSTFFSRLSIVSIRVWKTCSFSS